MAGIRPSLLMKIANRFCRRAAIGDQQQIGLFFLLLAFVVSIPSTTANPNWQLSQCEPHPLHPQPHHQPHSPSHLHQPAHWPPPDPHGRNGATAPGHRVPKIVMEHPGEEDSADGGRGSEDQWKPSIRLVLTRVLHTLRRSDGNWDVRSRFPESSGESPNKRRVLALRAFASDGPGPMRQREPERRRKSKTALMERPKDLSVTDGLKSMAGLWLLMTGLETISGMMKQLGGGGGGGPPGMGGSFFGGGGGGGGAGPRNPIPPQQDSNRPADCHLKSVEFYRFNKMWAYSYSKWKFEAGTPDKYGQIEGSLANRIKLKYKEQEFIVSVESTETIDKAVLWLKVKTNQKNVHLVNFTANCTSTVPLHKLHDFTRIHTNNYESNPGYEVVGLHLVESDSVLPLIRGIYQRRYKVSNAQYDHERCMLGGYRYKCINQDEVNLGKDRDMISDFREQPHLSGRSKMELMTFPSEDYERR